MIKTALFVHIPKTAGTSFRKALEQIPKVKMLYDYGAKSAESSAALLEAVENGQDVREAGLLISKKLNVLCGHVGYGKYARYVAPNNVFSILRNPVERVISEYQHLVRHAGYAKSFREFIETQPQNNKQSTMLKGFELAADAGVLGLTSHYEQFVQLVGKKLKLKMKVDVLNQAPSSDTKKRRTLKLEDVVLAYQLNKHDINLLHAVAQNFATQLQQAGVNTIPAEDAYLHVKVNRQQLVGWVPRRDQECFFVRVYVNGALRVILNTDQIRRDVYDQGLSTSPHCGFAYPLEVLGVAAGDRIRVDVMGGSAKCLRVIVFEQQEKPLVANKVEKQSLTD